MDINKEMEGLIEVADIENSKPFQRLSEKTQVLVPQTGQTEITKNRLTHSYEVATSAKLMAANIASKLGLEMKDIDYHNCMKQVCLLHDIGHPPFGHDGAKFISSVFKARGLDEGFSDNNNNLVVIEAHNIPLRDYVKASIIKYPKRLYPEQKEKYQPMLDAALEEDRKHFSKLGIKLKQQEQTMACQIMDEADRNSYVCSDLTDFFCLGNTIKMEDIKEIINLSSPKQFILAKKMIEAVNSGSKTQIKQFFKEMKNAFNFNYEITDNGLEVVDQELLAFRESLSVIEHQFFIKPIRKEKFHLENMNLLNHFVQNALDEGFCESSLYQKKINSARTQKEELTAIRDMVSEMSDWFIINTSQKQILERLNNHKAEVHKNNEAITRRRIKR